jgi:hypothetical protein
MSCYCKSKDCWAGLSNYNLSGKKKVLIEKYVPPVTISWPEWRQYIASGNNVLLGSGGIIPNGTIKTPFGGGAVYAGHVRQGFGY